MWVTKKVKISKIDQLSKVMKKHYKITETKQVRAKCYKLLQLIRAIISELN